MKLAQFQDSNYNVPIQLMQGTSGNCIDNSVIVCSEMDILEGERNRREVNNEGWEYLGELKKLGRQTSLWLTRYYVIKDQTLYIY